MNVYFSFVFLHSIYIHFETYNEISRISLCFGFYRVTVVPDCCIAQQDAIENFILTIWSKQKTNKMKNEHAQRSKTNRKEKKLLKPFTCTRQFDHSSKHCNLSLFAYDKTKRVEKFLPNDFRRNFNVIKPTIKKSINSQAIEAFSIIISPNNLIKISVKIINNNNNNIINI